MRAALLALAACSSAPAPKPVEPMSIDRWVEHCIGHFEQARRTLSGDPQLADTKFELHPAVKTVSIRLDVNVPPGQLTAVMSRDRAVCIDEAALRANDWVPVVEERQTGTITLPYAKSWFTRYRRIESNVGSIRADHEVPGPLAATFENEMQRAIDACFADSVRSRCTPTTIKSQ